MLINMRRQTGVTLSGLLFWGVVVMVGAVLGMRVIPAYISYSKILNATKAVAADANGKTVSEIRSAFSKYMEVEHESTITSADLDIYKNGSQVVVAFDYEHRVPLFANVSLLINFRGSSDER